MPKKKQPARKGGHGAPRKRTSKPRGETQPVLSDDDSNEALLAREKYDDRMHSLEQAWRVGNVPALTDALILCHQERTPLPLWLRRGSLALIKMLFTGKSLSRGVKGRTPTTHHRNRLIDYARWDAVKELGDRRDEIKIVIASLSCDARERRPKFAGLALDFSLGARYEAVAELFDLTDDPAKGGVSTIERAYKRVERDMRRGNSGMYRVPDRQNPLSSTYNPF
jgi:hypothetical protein